MTPHHAEIRAARFQWRRANDDYRAHPFAVCSGWLVDPDGTEHPCLNASHPRDVLCGGCRKAAAAARRNSAEPLDAEPDPV